MARSTHHPDYQTLLILLHDLRERANVSQVALAQSLGNTQTFISKIERGERRLDVIEFVELCEALEVDPIVAFQDYMQRRSTGRTATIKLSARK